MGRNVVLSTRFSIISSCIISSLVAGRMKTSFLQGFAGGILSCITSVSVKRRFCRHSFT